MSMKSIVGALLLTGALAGTAVPASAASVVWRARVANGPVVVHVGNHVRRQRYYYWRNHHRYTGYRVYRRW